MEKAENTRNKDGGPGSEFGKVLQEAIQDVNRSQNEANRSVQEMIVDKKDIHNTMIDMEKSGIAVKILLQARNKIIAAYEEVMRMQF